MIVKWVSSTEWLMDTQKTEYISINSKIQSVKR